MEAHQANGTWELTPLPEGHKITGSCWVFIIKCNENGTIDKYKARLVAQGFTQMPGVNYDQTFSPATHLATLHIILVKSVLNGEHLKTIDISNTYLNGKIEDKYEVYMCQPEGYEEQGPNSEKWVCQRQDKQPPTQLWISLGDKQQLWNVELNLYM